MFYKFRFSCLPIINKFYSVTRNTIWQFAEKEHLLIIITEGKCKISTMGEDFTLRKNDIAYIPSGQFFVRTPINSELCSMTYIHFTMDSPAEEITLPEMRKEIVETKNTLDYEILSGETSCSYPNIVYMQTKNTPDDNRITEFLNEINLYSTNRPLLCNLQSSVALCNILLNLSNSTIYSAVENSRLHDTPIIPPKLKKAISYITKNYSKQITLDELALHCNISKPQLIRYFNTTLKTTPLAYINGYKISKAKELINLDSHITFKEISYELGFDNQHYFSRVFKSISGESPAEYKKRIELIKKAD
ncbi:MAG: helix-turn-helix domain-containing protein [Clostridia bacterium]|nr:helix-turn-helix domain-containing protein [Clostridia bacterium]